LDDVEVLRRFCFSLTLSKLFVLILLASSGFFFFLFFFLIFDALWTACGDDGSWRLGQRHRTAHLLLCDSGSVYAGLSICFGIVDIAILVGIQVIIGGKHSRDAKVLEHVSSAGDALVLMGGFHFAWRHVYSILGVLGIFVGHFAMENGSGNFSTSTD